MIYFLPAQSRADYNALAADSPVGNVPLSLRTWLWSSPPGGSSNSLPSIHLEEENKPKLIKSTRHEGKGDT